MYGLFEQAAKRQATQLLHVVQDDVKNVEYE